MKVDLALDKTIKLPEGALPALIIELSQRLKNRYEECTVIIRRAGMRWVSVYGGAKEAKKTVEQIRQETCESANDWFC